MDEDRRRGRAGILASLEGMTDEERLPILREILPHLTDCQLSTDQGCIAYSKSGQDTFCPVKIAQCSDCCPEHECLGASNVPPGARAMTAIMIRMQQDEQRRRNDQARRLQSGPTISPAERARQDYFRRHPNDGPRY